MYLGMKTMPSIYNLVSDNWAALVRSMAVQL